MPWKKHSACALGFVMTTQSLKLVPCTGATRAEALSTRGVLLFGFVPYALSNGFAAEGLLKPLKIWTCRQQTTQQHSSTQPLVNQRHCLCRHVTPGYWHQPCMYNACAGDFGQLPG